MFCGGSCEQAKVDWGQDEMDQGILNRTDISLGPRTRDGKGLCSAVKGTYSLSHLGQPLDSSSMESQSNFLLFCKPREGELLD